MVADIWVEVEEEAFTAVVATVEVSAATTEVTAAEVMEAVITAAGIPAVMQVEADTAADIRAEALRRPDHGRGKGKDRRGTVLRVGMDFRGITAL